LIVKTKGGVIVASIDLKPQVLDLSLYAGDGVEFRLICTDSDGDPLNVSGNITAQIRVDRSETSTAIVDFDANLIDADQGIVALSLTGDDTQALMQDPSVSKDKFQGVWDVQWTPSSQEPRTLVQGKVECVADVTR
jgi:hypothetical protein